MINDEEWEEIRESPGYFISTYGRVLNSKHDRILSPRPSTNGYLAVSLPRQNKYINITVHKLVAMAFCPGWFPGAEVNHKDLNKHNNYDTNLEWETAKGNSRHAAAHGVTGRPGRVVRVRETNTTFASTVACGLYYKVNPGNIHYYASNPEKTWKGLHFEFVE